jgi:hypothetical protein
MYFIGVSTVVHPPYNSNLISQGQIWVVSYEGEWAPPHQIKFLVGISWKSQIRLIFYGRPSKDYSSKMLSPCFHRIPSSSICDIQGKPRRSCIKWEERFDPPIKYNPNLGSL